MKKHLSLLSLFFLVQTAFGQQANNKIYTKKVDFNGKTIPKGVDFDRWTFSKTADFSWAEFSKTADFGKAKFLDTADFYGAAFSKDARFSGAKFSKDARFSGAKFSGSATFLQAAFSKNARFSGAEFSKDARFFLVKFSKRADFYEAKFSKRADFGGTEFYAKSTLTFSQLVLTDSTRFDFDRTLFPDTILFYNNTDIKNVIDFTNADFITSTKFNKNRSAGKPILICLFNTDISKLHLDYVHFKLWLPDSTIDSHFDKRLISDDQKASIYESLLNNFKASGQTKSYQLLDIEYQEFKWGHSWAKFLTWVPRWWWNFGYDKEYIFVWTIGLLLVFTCISYFFIYSLNTKIYVIEKIPVNELWARKVSFKNFVPRFWSSLMYTSSVFFKLSIDIKNLEFKERRGTAYIILVYTIGVLCIAYMANFVLQKT